MRTLATRTLQNITYHLCSLFVVKSATGEPWRFLTLQNSSDWHLQTKMRTYIRNDTKKRNSSPRAITKPYYRYVCIVFQKFKFTFYLYRSV